MTKLIPKSPKRLVTWALQGGDEFSRQNGQETDKITHFSRFQNTLSLLTNEKKGGLKVVSFETTRFKLFTLKFSNKSMQIPSCERPKTTQRSLWHLNTKISVKWLWPVRVTLEVIKRRLMVFYWSCDEGPLNEKKTAEPPSFKSTDRMSLLSGRHPKWAINAVNSIFNSSFFFFKCR